MLNKNVEHIKTRRSVRGYISKKINTKTINSILEAGLSAPSSKNSQPWFILVLSGKEKNKIPEMMLTNASDTKNIPKNIKNPKLSESIQDSTNYSAKIIQKASHLFLIFNKAPFTVSPEDLAKNANVANLFTYNTELLGIGACMENILLASHFYGLGAVALCDIYPARDAIKKEFNVPYNFSVGIAVGHTDEKPRYRIDKNKNNSFKIIK